MPGRHGFTSLMCALSFTCSSVLYATVSSQPDLQPDLQLEQAASSPLMHAAELSRPMPTGIQPFALDQERLHTLRQLPIGEGVSIERIMLANGTSAEAALQRVEVFTPDARVRMMRGTSHGGYVEELLPIPEVLLLSGQLTDDPDTIVFIAIHQDSIAGYVRTAQCTQIISSGSSADPQPAVIYDPALIPFDKKPIDVQRTKCRHAGQAPQPHPRQYPELADDSDSGDGFGGLASSGLSGCSQVRMAIDTDADMLNQGFNGSSSNLLIYVIQLAAAQMEIYRHDVRVHLPLAYVTVWDTDDEPWTRPDDDPDAPNVYEQLVEYRDWYDANEDPDEYDLAHLLIFDALGGGVAWRAELCEDDPYAISTGLNCSFPYPVESYSQGNWDLSLFAHENGHILGAIHTHEYCPPIDQCPSGSAMGDCQDETICQRGTLMSYCDLNCPGELANMHLGFHPESVAMMQDHINSSNCLPASSSTVNAFDDSGTTVEDVPIGIDVLANDRTTCTLPFVWELPESTDAGGSLSLLGETFPFERMQILYTPPAGFTGTDSFSYSCMVGLFDDIDSADVAVEVAARPDTTHELLVADNHFNSVVRFDADTGQCLGTLVESGAGGLDTPTAMALGPDGDLFITSFVTDDVRRFDGATGADLGVFYSSTLKNPIAIQIDDSYAYILGMENEPTPTVPFPRLQLNKVSLSTGTTVDRYFSSAGFGIDLNIRSDGKLIMLIQSGGDELVQLDSTTLTVDATFSLVGYQVEKPVSADGRNSIAILDAERDAVVRINPENFAFQSSTNWSESDWANFQALEILYADNGRQYCLHDRGIDTFSLNNLTSLIDLIPAHLHSPRAMLLREVAPPLPADFNGDGLVNGVDLTQLLGAWGQESEFDLNGDGVIDGFDLAQLLGSWTVLP